MKKTNRKINKKINLLSMAFLLMVVEVIAKFLGFIKQMIIAYYFGAQNAIDVYFVASDFINGFSNAIISSARIAIIAVYTSYRLEKSEHEGARLISKILQLVTVISIVMMFIFNIFSKQISYILAPAYSDNNRSLLTKYIFYLSGIIILTFVCMVFESILNSHEIFLINKLRSIFYSVIIILFCITLAQKYNVKVLIWGQYGTLILYLVVQVVFAYKYIVFDFTRIIYYKKQIVNVFKTMIPIVLGNSAICINYMVDNAVASSLSSGSVSALAYSHTLDDFFVGVFITSTANILFPHFSKLIAQNKVDEVREGISSMVNAIIIFIIPVSVIAFCGSRQIIEVIYYRGVFDYSVVLNTAIALQGYVLRYPFAIMRDFSIQGLYAYKSIKAPMVNAVITTIINIVISVLFSKKYGIIAITFGTTFSVVIGGILNMRLLMQKVKGLSFKPTIILLAKCIFPVSLSVGCIRLISHYIFNPIVYLVVESFICIVTYLGFFFIVKEPEFYKMLKMVLSRRKNI